MHAGVWVLMTGTAEDEGLAICAWAGSTAEEEARTHFSQVARSVTMDLSLISQGRLWAYVNGPREWIHLQYRKYWSPQSN